MSSKRGRKRNDNLPPNRARDVQRAFRARRAAHLQALEQRVQELEEENDCLRAALNLPPANRPNLGKGPTGKDKPKPYDAGLSRPGPSASDSRTSSSPDSPASVRTNSISPSAMTAPVRSSSRDQLMDGHSWEPQMLMDQTQTPVDARIPAVSPPASSTTTSSSFPITPVSAPMPQKTIQSFPFGNSGSRMQMSPHLAYPHSADRPVDESYAGSSYSGRTDTYPSPSQLPPPSASHHYAYPQPTPPQPPYSAPQLALQLPHSPAPMHHPGRSGSPPPPNILFAQRRSITEPQGYREVVNLFPHLRNSSELTHGIRLPSPPLLQDDDCSSPMRTPAPHSYPNADG